MTTPPNLNEDLRWLSSHPRTRQRAWGHNFLFDPMIDTTRRAIFEEEFELAQSAPDFDPDIHDGHAILQAHARYYARWMEGGREPQTFQGENGRAAIPKFAETVWLVRLERLTQPLLRAGMKDRFPELKAAFSAGARRSAEETATLRQFLEKWNEHAWNRPRFAARETELREELHAADWPERLRSRLGLADYEPGPGGSLPVAVMMYRASEIRRLTRGRSDIAHLFARPTVLDQPPCEYFYPAPESMNGGRCMQLVLSAGKEDTLFSELLHPKFDYRLEHIFRLGEITAPVPDESLRRLRNRHLELLRAACDDCDFGAMIPDDVLD